MIYVCSDLHGYSIKNFKSLLKKIGFCDNDELYIVGDVIDRGKDGITILKWMMTQSNVHLILGNHEQLMCKNSFLFNQISDDITKSFNSSCLLAYSTWITNSGLPTIETLKKEPQSEIKKIFQYIKNAPLYETVTVNKKNFVLTHSGFKNFASDKKLSEYEPDELLWNRPSFEQKYFNDATVVFGHTPTAYYGKEYEGKVLFTDTWIDIDVGIMQGHSPAILRLDDLVVYYGNNFCEKEIEGCINK